MQGNLDPCNLYASKNDLKAAATKMCKMFQGQKHIANLGHGIYPDVDPEHLKVYIDTVHEVSASLKK